METGLKTSWVRSKNAPGELIFNLARAGCKSLVRVKINRLEREQGDRALMAEILEPAKSGPGIIRLPGVSHSPDKTVRKPNCLGGVSLLGDKRLYGAGRSDGVTGDDKSQGNGAGK